MDIPDTVLGVTPKFKSFGNNGIPFAVVPAIALSSSNKSEVINLYDTLTPLPPLAYTPELTCIY